MTEWRKNWSQWHFYFIFVCLKRNAILRFSLKGSKLIQEGKNKALAY